LRYFSSLTAFLDSIRGGNLWLYSVLPLALYHGLHCSTKFELNTGFGKRIHVTYTKWGVSIDRHILIISLSCMSEVQESLENIPAKVEANKTQGWYSASWLSQQSSTSSIQVQPMTGNGGWVAFHEFLREYFGTFWLEGNNQPTQPSKWQLSSNSRGMLGLCVRSFSKAWIVQKANTRPVLGGQKISGQDIRDQNGKFTSVLSTREKLIEKQFLLPRLSQMLSRAPLAPAVSTRWWWMT